MAKFNSTTFSLFLLLALSVELTDGRNSNARGLAEESKMVASRGPSQTPPDHHLETYRVDEGSSVNAFRPTTVFKGGYYLQGQDCLLNLCQTNQFAILGQPQQEINEPPPPYNHSKSNYTDKGSSVHAFRPATVLFEGGYFLHGQDCFLNVCRPNQFGMGQPQQEKEAPNHSENYTSEGSIVDAFRPAIVFQGGYFLKGQDCQLNMCQIYQLPIGQSQQENQPSNHSKTNYTVHEGSSVDAFRPTAILEGAYFMKGQDCLLNLCQIYQTGQRQQENEP